MFIPVAYNHLFAPICTRVINHKYSLWGEEVELFLIYLPLLLSHMYHMFPISY